MFRTTYPKRKRALLYEKGSMEIMDLLDDLGVKGWTLRSDKKGNGAHLVEFSADWPTYRMVVKMAVKMNDEEGVIEF